MKAHFAIRVTHQDGHDQLIDNVSIPVLRGTMESAKNLSGTAATHAILCFDDGLEEYEIELTQSQITSLNLQSFRKADRPKVWVQKG
ncbi:MAG: hypothetical protein FWF59_05385 [Turicibacter sp.]|nr:hypothetical protein [Turicibacter sp.]